MLRIFPGFPRESGLGPLIIMCPAFNFNSPNRAISKELFPHPTGPTNTCNCPTLMVISMDSRTYSILEWLSSLSTWLSSVLVTSNDSLLLSSSLWLSLLVHEAYTPVNCRAMDGSTLPLRSESLRVLVLERAGICGSFLREATGSKCSRKGAS